MGYYENKVYSINRQSYSLASKHFENSWFRYLDDCQVLLIKPDYLLLLLYQINNNIQFTIEKSQTRLPFLNIKINKSGTKNLDGYLQHTNRLKTLFPIYVRLPTALFKQIYRSLLQEEYLALLKMKM